VPSSWFFLSTLKWSIVCSLVPQGHVGVLINLNRCKYDLILPCTVTTDVKLWVKFIHMFNLISNYREVLFGDFPLCCLVPCMYVYVLCMYRVSEKDCTFIKNVSLGPRCDIRIFYIPNQSIKQSKLGVSSSNQCNLHHSPHTGHLKK